MNIEVGNTYRTLNGKRAFFIFGKKRKSTTGFNYAGECSKTGLVAYFTETGEHSHQGDLWLEVDTDRYIPINPDGTMASDSFLKRDSIPDGRYIGYVVMSKGAFETIRFQGRL